MILQKIAKKVAESFFFKKAQTLWKKNQENFWLRLSKFEKLYVGTYIILQDYSEGLFPPTFTDQQATYEGERQYVESLPGIDPSQVLDSEIRKPFWFGGEKYMKYFIRMSHIFQKCGIHPPAKVLELGAGCGWMSEFLSLMKFEVIATTISQSSINQIEQRISSIKAKGVESTLSCYETPMESISDFLKDKNVLPVDAVFVFEALHHAYDWEQTLQSAFLSLKSGGWLVICNEPNILHTFISYRVAKLSNTHEIGLSRASLVNTLKSIGFSKVKVYSNRIDFGVVPHWIAAQK